MLESGRVSRGSLEHAIAELTIIDNWTPKEKKVAVEDDPINAEWAAAAAFCLLILCSGRERNDTVKLIVGVCAGRR